MSIISASTVDQLCQQFVDSPHLKIHYSCLGTPSIADDSDLPICTLEELADRVYHLTLGRHSISFNDFIKVERLALKVVELEEMNQQEKGNACLITYIFIAICDFFEWLFSCCQCYPTALEELQIHKGCYASFPEARIDPELLAQFPPNNYDSSNRDALYTSDEVIRIYGTLVKA